MSIGALGIQHIGVSVPDLDQARHFYLDLLGGVEVGPPLEWDDNPFIDAVVGLKNSAARQFMCQLGNTCIEVFEYLAPRSDPQDPDQGVNRYGYTHFGVQVEDIQATYQRLLEAGLRVHTPPSMAGISVDADGVKHGYAATYCRDPFGNVFEIMEIYDDAQIRPIWKAGEGLVVPA
ncbi:glyoxalase/bleomycin resistance/dioxygenase family protein [Novosphingobium sp. FSY-8]|uniref:Glyoxalase/bleomycin resistance/dioxygenase family protein n=1 Tax=Novosphingobium ovatum TaxID=1908523 RepID=A0ABW9XHQ9_9SPHN|nr:VOC family protein [Novosphingobium ovatum]NBC38094.1 glyoxalase/bleomycin resistance/dioxygenase family protein [Novosphingobium ovatum]